MDVQRIHLLTSIPGRAERRLVPAVKMDLFAEVMDRIAARWGMQSWQGCAVSCYAASLNLTVVMSNQEEYALVQSKGFFVPDDDKLGLLQLEFFKLEAAAPSDAELSITGQADPSALKNSLDAERAAHATLKSAHFARSAQLTSINAEYAQQATTLAQLSVENSQLKADNAMLKADIAKQAAVRQAQAQGLTALYGSANLPASSSTASAQPRASLPLSRAKLRPSHPCVPEDPVLAAARAKRWAIEPQQESSTISSSTLLSKRRRPSHIPGG